MDVATAPLTDSEPLLLLYTSVRRRRQAKHELDLMIFHEYDDDDEPRVRQLDICDVMECVGVYDT